MGGVKMEEKNQNEIGLQVIRQWMEHYPPAEDDCMFKLQLTSYEIAEILSEFCQVEPGEVTRELLGNGYKLTRTGEGEMKWMIKNNTRENE